MSCQLTLQQSLEKNQKSQVRAPLGEWEPSLTSKHHCREARARTESNDSVSAAHQLSAPRRWTLNWTGDSQRRFVRGHGGAVRTVLTAQNGRSGEPPSPQRPLPRHRPCRSRLLEQSDGQCAPFPPAWDATLWLAGSPFPLKWTLRGGRWSCELKDSGEETWRISPRRCVDHDGALKLTSCHGR